MIARKGSKVNIRVRADGRRPLLVYLNREVIKALKKAALDEDRTAYEITEEAVSEWLRARRAKGVSRIGREG